MGNQGGIYKNIGDKKKKKKKTKKKTKNTHMQV